MSMFLRILLSVIIGARLNKAQGVTIEMDLNNLIAISTDYFVSYTFDTANWYGSPPINTTSETLQYMAKQLNPAVLRVGGSAADKTYYFTDEETGQCSNVPDGYYCFTKENLEGLMNFVSNVGCKLIFSLSIGYPTYPDNKTPSWNSTNTEYFLNYIVNNNYGKLFYGFELGNEVNNHVSPSFQINAFKQLRSILQNIYGKKNLDIPILAGPDPHSYTLRADNSSWQWVENFIQGACDGVVDAFTYHCYIDVNATNLLTPSGINEQYKESNRFQQAVMKYCPNHYQPIYAGEIAEQNGGGTDGFTNRYEDTLWYLNALGVLSSMGQHGVFRQQLWGDAYHPNYALLNDINDAMYIPLPDYWVAVLFNQLMTPYVFNVTSSDDSFKVYTHCWIGNTPSVVMAYVNFNDKTIPVSFNNRSVGVHHIDYILTSDKYQLDTTTIHLNGNNLALNKDHTLPQLNGNLSTSNPIQIPPYSVGFIHFSDVRNQLCR